MSNEIMLREEPEEGGYVTAEVYLSPLPGIEPMRVKARVGSLVRDILPAEARAPMVCLIDGVPIKREWWMERPVCEGDRIQFAPVYLGGGGGGSKGILGAIAAIALSVFVPGMVAAWGMPFSTAGTVASMTFAGHLVSAGLILLGNALISAVIGTPSGSSVGQGDVASSVYSVDAQGNSAKVFQPIPVQYGRMKYFPNFAAQPYSYFYREVPDIIEVRPDILKSAGPSGIDHSHGLQYYYALFCLGQGHYDIENILIADADIDSFQDVYYNVLAPGERPINVNPCVVTSDAVNGMSLDEGTWVGPFPICGPDRRAHRIDLHFVFPQGLCRLDDKGKANPRSVQFFIQFRFIDDRGNPYGNWFNIYNSNEGVTFTASSLTPQRRSIHTNFVADAITNEPAYYRLECRVMRNGVRDKDDQKDISSVQWSGLAAYLNEPAPLCETATHLEIVMRASEQLSSVSQRKISVVATRKVPSWDDPTPTASRSPARALFDKWTNKVYGDGMPVDRIDIEMLRQLDALSNERQDYFDYVFENRVSSQEADQTIAKSIRSVALQRQGVKTVVRDELCDMPLTLFNPTNIAEKSVTLDYVQITEETTDGVIVEYFSNLKWDWEEVECPGPGRTYSNTSNPQYNPALPVMENPARITLNGVTDRKHAEREGLYYAYTNALRRQFATWTTELQGALVYYGAPVLLSTTLYASQQGGEIRDYDGDVMQLTNGVRAGKIVLMRNDGSLTEPMGFTIVDPNTNSIRLHGMPDFTVNYGDYASERTKYVILEGEMIRRIVKILSITPKGIGDNGAPMYELKGVVDVPEVHTVDNFLLVPDAPYVPPVPGPDDPTPPSPTPTSGNYTVKLRSIAPNPYCLTYQALYPNSGYPATIALYPDGALRTLYYDRTADANPVMRGAIPGQEQTWNHWVEGAPIQNVGSLYEAMFIGYWGLYDLFNSSNYPSPLGDKTNPSEEFLNNPKRFYMDGYKLYYTTAWRSGGETQISDPSTQSAVNQAAARFPSEDSQGASTKHIVYTDWVPLDSNVEFRGYWDTRPVPYPDGIPYGTYFRTRYFAVAIRDKATHTVQAVQTYQLGFWREYDSYQGGA